MKQLLKFSLLLVVMFGCHRDKVDYLGPAYIYAPKGFNVSDFSAVPDPVSFNSGPKKVTFNAIFSDNVSWILTLKGDSTEAVHIMRGISKGFTNLDWTGNHDEVTFFRSGETVTATLSFYGSDYTKSIQFKINSAPNFKTCGIFASGGDFEIESAMTNWHGFNVVSCCPFVYLENVEQGRGTAEVDFNGNRVKPVQGLWYYYIRGKGEQDVFVSGLSYDPFSTFPDLPSDPTKVWVNMYIYGTGDANAGVELEYQESDESDTHTPNTYNGKDDDAWTAKFSLTHKGWKLFSFQYSTLTPSLNADFGGSGNKIQEPHRLKSFDLVAVKKTNKDKPIEIYFDYPIITVGGPFKPCR